MDDTINDVLEIIGAIAVVTLTIIGAAVLTAFPIMLSWNYLMPDLFGLPTIDFWQALVMSILARCLFGSKLGSGTSSSKK